MAKKAKPGKGRITPPAKVAKNNRPDGDKPLPPKGKKKY